MTDEAIKWPELNTHGGEHALPTHSTGRAGFGEDGDDSRPPSNYASSLATTSTPELYGGTGSDPYAVPPLPHLNPNQPYHDEPGYVGQDGQFYDPYRGPVPTTFNDAGGVGMGLEGQQQPGAGYGGEAIPMTQMRTRSPGPGMGYEMGRASPQPTMVNTFFINLHLVLMISFRVGSHPDLRRLWDTAGR